MYGVSRDVSVYMVYILKYMYKGYKGYKGLYNMMVFTYLFPRPLFQRSVGVD